MEAELAVPRSGSSGSPWIVYGSARVLRSFCGSCTAVHAMDVESAGEMAAISTSVPNADLHHFQRWTGRFVQFPADRPVIPIHRELSRRRTLLPRVPDEEDSVSGQRHLDCQFDLVRPLSPLADSPNVAPCRPGSGNRVIDAASQGPVRSGRLSLFY